MIVAATATRSGWNPTLKTLLLAGLVALPTTGVLTYAMGQESADVISDARAVGAEVELSVMGRHLTAGQAVADVAWFDSANRTVEVTGDSGDAKLALAPTVTLHTRGRALNESAVGAQVIDLTDWCLQAGEGEAAKRYMHSTGTITAGDCS